MEEEPTCALAVPRGLAPALAKVNAVSSHVGRHLGLVLHEDASWGCSPGTGEALLRTFDSSCAAAVNAMEAHARGGAQCREKAAVMP